MLAQLALGQVGVHQGARFGVDTACYLLLVELFPHLVVAVFHYAPHELGIHCHHGGETHIAHAETGHSGHQFDEIPGRKVSPTQLFADKDGRGVAGDKRAVEIENCSDLRAFG